MSQNPVSPATPKPLYEPEVKHDEKVFVRVFLEENFRGRAYRVPVPCELSDDKELMKYGIPNDRIQSMLIPDGVVVTLFDNFGYGGKSKAFKGSAANLGEMRGCASALKTALVAAKP